MREEALSNWRSAFSPSNIFVALFRQSKHATNIKSDSFAMHIRNPELKQSRLGIPRIQILGVILPLRQFSIG
jgi:hypothetical protein